MRLPLCVCAQAYQIATNDPAHPGYINKITAGPMVSQDGESLVYCVVLAC
jgi:hypothetical protein